MAAARGRGIPYVFSPHGKLGRPGGGPLWSAKGLWWRLVAGRLVRGAAAVITSGTREASWLAGDRGARRAIPNGYSREGPDRSLAGAIREPYVLFLGHLDPRKQPGFLIEAFGASALRATHRLVLAGPDSYGQRARLEAVTRGLGLSDRVAFTGCVAGGPKWALLTGARCLCLPSLSEGQPLVLAEALGAGLPAVYSEGCNFPEIAEAGAGIELRGFDRGAWTRALEAVCLDDSAAGTMRVAAERLAPDYTWDSVVGRWASLYRDILHRDPRPSAGS
jgi:glycosyltransferase involved in cell wall biosynthesis